MAIRVSIDLGYEFAVKAPADEVFALLADVPRSVSHFPKVERLTDLGDGAYKWEMQKVGTPQVHIQTVYACKYVSDAAQGTVVWTPVRGVGNAVVSGHWKLAARKASARANAKANAKAKAEATDIELAIQGTIELPLPGLMKMVVAPIVESEFEKLVDQYIDNLIRAFGGEV